MRIFIKNNLRSNSINARRLFNKRKSTLKEISR